MNNRSSITGLFRQAVRYPRLVLFILLMIIPSACSSRSGDRSGSGEEGWIDLFDGASLAGWEVVDKGKWSVEGGELVGRWDPDDPGGGFLMTTKDYGDFVLELEFHVGLGGNSGVTIRDVSHGGDFESPSRYGYEVQIYNVGASAMPTGSLYELARAPGDLSRDNEWNSLRVRAVGDHLTTWVNGHKAAELHDRRSFRGAIDLQIHDRNAPTRFRNVRIKPLEPEMDFWPMIEDRLDNFRGPVNALLTGPDLGGWRRTGRGGWRFAGGVTTSSGGPDGASLTAGEEFGNFLLSLDYKLTPETGGWVQVRCPGDSPDGGYRVRLFDTDSDAVAEPTGSIVGLGRALAGLARAGEWNALRIYACRDQLTVLVNGRKAVELHDSGGLRGAIGFGVDPGRGQLQLRNVTIKPYPDIK